VTGKSADEISSDVKGFVDAGGKLPPHVTDLTTVGWTVTSIGKGAAKFAVSVLPPTTSGILSIGRMGTGEGAETYISLCMCHATLTGQEGSKILQAVASKFR